jgi:Domain of unknown function (DUF5655)/Domain of unknown function (DUF4287)
MVQKWISELKPKTGRSLEEWLALIQREAPQTGRERFAWLKAKHKLATNSAWWLAERSEGRGTEDDSPERYLAAAKVYLAEQYAGKKEALRPIYEELLQQAVELGPDVKACPCKSMVPLYRNNVFAQLKATNNARFDLGLALTQYRGKLPKRLVGTGGIAKKDRITHRIELKSLDDIDAEVGRWLKTAYDLDAK